MAAEKTPVLMVLGIRTEQQQWFLAEITLSGDATPLLRSEPGSFQEHLGQPLDDQVALLRHRLAGALQRGCDRLWGRNCKAAHIVIVADGDFDESVPELTQAIADHFHVWMTRPPVTFLQLPRSTAADRPAEEKTLVGHLEPDEQSALRKGLPVVVEAMDFPDRWEVISRPRAS